MSDLHDQSPEEELPQPLREALAGLYPRQFPVPAEIDDVILTSARAGYAWRRRWIWAGRIGVAVAAAAAMIAMAIHLTLPQTPIAPATALQARAIVGDVNGDGRVDVLDAFIVARSLHNGGRLDPAWDVNGDGKIDEKDVDWIANQAVRVDERKLQ